MSDANENISTLSDTNENTLGGSGSGGDDDSSSSSSKEEDRALSSTADTATSSGNNARKSFRNKGKGGGGGDCNLSNANTTLVFSIVFSVLFVVASFLAIMSNTRFREMKESAAIERYEAQVDLMKLYVDKNTDAVFRSLTDLSVRTTSIVKRLAEEEPEYPPGFVAIPDTAETLGMAREVSNALVIAYLPRVGSEHRDLWEKSYTKNHSSWIAEEQPIGGVVPKIEETIWEYEDYEFENEDNSGDRRLQLRGSSSSDGVVRKLNAERPGDCAGEERRRRMLSEKVDSPQEDTFFTPVWQMDPVPIVNETDPYVGIINYNLMDRVVFYKALKYIEKTRKPVLLDVCDQSSWFLVDKHRVILQTAVVAPVFEDFSDTAPIVGYHVAVVPWASFFRNDRDPESSIDMVVDVSNSCGEYFSVELRGNNVTILGEETDDEAQQQQQEKREFKKYVKHLAFADEYAENEDPPEEICWYTLSFYPLEL